jgi:tetratricopeptide (TPR) repeat protein
MSLRRAPFLISLLIWLVTACSQASPWTDIQVKASLSAAEAHLGKAYQYIQEERYSEAETELQAALLENPALTNARYQLAICEFALGRFRDAQTQFLALSSKMPGDARLDYYLGRIDLVQGDTKAAVARLREVVLKPPFSDTAYYLGAAYLKAGDLPKAETWLKRAAAADPRDFRVPDHLARVYQREHRVEQAEEEYQKSAALHHYYDERSSQALRCDQALNVQPLSQAQQICRRLGTQSDPDMLTLLGMLYGQHGDYEEALPVLVRAAKIDPDSWEVQHNLGLTYFRLKRYPEAVAALRQAVSMRPDYFGSSALLGASLYTLKQDRAAFQALDHAHQLNPSEKDTSELLFNESLVLGKKAFLAKDYADCVKFLGLAAALHPEDYNIRHKLEKVEQLRSSAPENHTEP